MNRIINYDEFKALPNKEAKREYLRELLQHYPEQAIRNHWGITPGAFYQQVRYHDLMDERPEKKQPSRKIVQNIIDAEFTTSTNDRPGANTATGDSTPYMQFSTDYSNPAPTVTTNFPVLQQQQSQAEVPIMNLPEMTGTTKQLRQLMEGMIMILEATSGEDTPLKLKISVYRGG